MRNYREGDYIPPEDRWEWQYRKEMAARREVQIDAAFASIGLVRPSASDITEEDVAAIIAATPIYDERMADYLRSHGYFYDYLDAMRASGKLKP